ncbi:glycerophosphodiester phosphodiesterase [Mucilaginibacter pallidiroseus]|uniref:Glycerophosphodiester phosphodiesterase n=1 Tax=Mucilaginibacter pallidiroseus TaxID=2599295 RepID=A0A563UG03_9SPHI|nr:glycerophosphodiester phosphodiesterase family protein [Mucilaginibacter pallidiroseus]TWR30267.1 glycerophosphodiester phosphodiesterase [Mucilaginibacter pallidiroseus]
MTYKFTKALTIAIATLITQTATAQQTFDKQGHRGGRGLMPENTIAAMKKAVDLGVTLEMDISFSEEKLPIVSHDQYLNPKFVLKPNGDTLTKADGKALRLYNMPYGIIKTYDVGSKYYPQFPEQQKMKVNIPLLSALIDTVEAYAKQKGAKPPHYNIETKTSPKGDNIEHPGPKEFVDLLIGVLKDKKVLDRVIIQSFDARTLEIMHLQYPQVPTAWLVSNKLTLNENLATLSFKPTIYSPDYKMVTRDVVDGCHAKGIKIIPWTVNDPEKIKEIKALGVDGIISDYPNRL